MLGEFLARLAVALPLVCAAAALSLIAVRRGWIGLPRFMLKGPRPAAAASAAPVLAVSCVKSLGPAARVAVVRFDGRDHLLAVAGSSVVLLAAAAGQAQAPSCQAQGRSGPSTPTGEETERWPS